MNKRARRFMRRYPTYKDFLVAIHHPSAGTGKDVLEEMAEIVGETDLVDDYFDPLVDGDMNAGNYIFKKYNQVKDLAAEA